MKKHKIQPKTALGAVVVDMNPIANADTTATAQTQDDTKEPETAEEPEKPKSLEEVIAENERLRLQLESQPKTLAEKIDFFKKKEDLIKQLSRLDRKRESLFQVLELTQEAAEKDEFVAEAFALNVTHKPGYNADEVFKISNPVIIGEVLQFVIARLDVKREELQFLISA